jgi:hypothetical protein
MSLDFWVNFKHLNFDHLVTLPNLWKNIKSLYYLTKNCVLSVKMFGIFLIKNNKELASTSISTSVGL